MLKKTGTLFVSCLLLIPAIIPVFSVFYAEETRICGIDNLNYPSIDYAKKNKIPVSYEFPCEFPTSENGLYERSQKIEFTGMLIEFFEGENSAQFFIRDNFDKSEYLVRLNTDYKKLIETAIPGDQLKIIGTINQNTKIITANSINDVSQKGLNSENCVIVSFEHNLNKINCASGESALGLFHDNNSRIVAGLKNPARVEDLQIGDYIRCRFENDNLLKLLILTKRNNTDFLRSRIFETNTKFISKEINEAGLINIEVINDTETNKIKLKIDDNTRLVKKYFGISNLDDFAKNDDLYIVARANDDGTNTALLIKNNSVWK